MLNKKIKNLSLVLGLSMLFCVCPITSYASTESNTNAENEVVSNQVKQTILTDKDEVEKYALDHNSPLEDPYGNKIKQIILNTDKEAEKEVTKIPQSNISTKLIGDTCTIRCPYEGYNTNTIAWSTSRVGPATLSNTVSRETSSEIFGEFSGKTSVVEAKVGFKIDTKTTCTSSYSVNLAAYEKNSWLFQI